jgi:hypothetical protein
MNELLLKEERSPGICCQPGLKISCSAMVVGSIGQLSPRTHFVRIAAGDEWDAQPLFSNKQLIVFARERSEKERREE